MPVPCKVDDVGTLPRGLFWAGPHPLAAMTTGCRQLTVVSCSREFPVAKQELPYLGGDHPLTPTNLGSPQTMTEEHEAT